MLEQPSDGRQAASRSGAVSRISPARGASYGTGCAFGAAIGHTGCERCAGPRERAGLFVGLAGRELLEGWVRCCRANRYALACPCLVAACLRAACRSLPTLPMGRCMVIAISA